MAKIISFANSVIGWVDARKKPMDTVAAVLLALVPILQHYIGIVDNAATTVLVLLLPYLVLRAATTAIPLKLDKLSLVLVLGVFFLFKLFAHGTSFKEIAQVVLMLSFLFFVSQGVIDTKQLTNAVILIAAMAGAFLLVQYVCYYIFGFHVQLVPTRALLAEAQPWVLGAQTGKVAITGKVSSFYRPSAFFLEPSHLFMYAFPALCLSVFSKKKGIRHWINRLLVSAGMVLCTSGMGIATMVCVWCAYFMLNNHKDGTVSLRNIVRKRNLILMGIFAGGFVLLVLVVPFLRESVVRIFNNPGGSTAIDGRTERAIMALREMSAVQWIAGTSDNTAALPFNMPGFMAIAYKYGVIGIVLSYEFYVRSMAKLDIRYFLFAAILLLASFFSAHTHGTFFMLYYVLLLMEGHCVCRESWLQSETAFLGNKLRSLFCKLKERQYGKYSRK